MAKSSVDELDNSPAQTSFLTVPVSILIGSVIISLSILLGSGIIKVKGFQSGRTGGLGAAAASPAPTTDTTAAAPEEPSGPVKVSLDDDPVLGQANAPVTLVEFTDYECPFCKRHFDQTFSQIKKEYIDTGKVKLVTRDLPLSFHPNAEKLAMAVNCSRDQGGDEMYYKFHDKVFGDAAAGDLTNEGLAKFATDLGINGTTLTQCITDEKYKDEISKDSADANAIGATGTPSFVVGKSTGDEIEGEVIVGAYPYATFKSKIDALLQ